MDEIRKMAHSGNLNGYIGFYMSARTLGDGTLISEAKELWQRDQSATARLYYKYWVSKDLAAETREGMLLTAQAAIENHWHQNEPHDYYVRQSSQHQKMLDNLYASAESENEDAQWVVSQLNTRKVNISAALN